MCTLPLAYEYLEIKFEVQSQCPLAGRSTIRKGPKENQIGKLFIEKIKTPYFPMSFMDISKKRGVTKFCWHVVKETVEFFTKGEYVFSLKKN